MGTSYILDRSSEEGYSTARNGFNVQPWQVAVGDSQWLSAITALKSGCVASNYSSIEKTSFEGQDNCLTD